jgi:hypothetical protein
MVRARTSTGEHTHGRSWGGLLKHRLNDGRDSLEAAAQISEPSGNPDASTRLEIDQRRRLPSTARTGWINPAFHSHQRSTQQLNVDRSGTYRWHRCNVHHGDTAGLCGNCHRKKLSSRLTSRRPSDTVPVLLSPLKNLVGVDTVLSCYSCDRCTRHQRCLNNTVHLLRWRTIRCATRGYLNRLAHRAIVEPIAPSVYTATSGRLPAF